MKTNKYSIIDRIFGPDRMASKPYMPGTFVEITGCVVVVIMFVVVYILMHAYK